VPVTRADLEDERSLVELLAPLAEKLGVAAEKGDIAFVIRPPVSAGFASGFQQLFDAKVERTTTVVLLGPEIAEAGPWDLVTKAWMQRRIRVDQLKVLVLDGPHSRALLLTLTFSANGVAIAQESNLIH
jgi:hypothetical protein